MKRTLYLFMMMAGLFLTACEKDEVGSTATEKVAGEWYVTVDLVNADGSLVYTGEEFFALGKFIVNTYNTAANVSNEMWVDDLGNFWDFKVKTQSDVNALTFMTNGAVANTSYEGCDVTITEGKILPKAATTPHGTPADSIVFYVSFSDDDYPDKFGYDKYKISGYRYTGLASDD